MKSIKDTQKHKNIYVIAEVASSHEGNKELALNLLKASADVGADAVKFQIFSAEALLTPNHHRYNSFCEIELKPDEWENIHAECKKIGLPFIAEIFDENSFYLMERLGIEIFKIHSTDLMNPLLLKRVAETGKTIILSCGGSTLEEIKYAVSLIESTSNHNISLMHGFQSFPTRLNDTFLLDILRLESEFGYPVGFADHCDADTEYAFYLPLVAIGLGACIIEKHITLDRSLKGRDYYSALNPDEFKRMISAIRNIEIAFGLNHNGLTKAELEYRKLMKKNIVAALPIKEGEEITLSHLAFKRTPVPGIQPSEYLKFIGRKAKLGINIHTLIKEDDFL